MSSCVLLPRHIVAAVLGLICICLYGSATTASIPIAAAAPNKLEIKAMAHPFLFFSVSDVASLRASTSTTRKAQFDRLQAWGKQFAAFEPLATGKLPGNRDVEGAGQEDILKKTTRPSLGFPSDSPDTDGLLPQENFGQMEKLTRLVATRSEQG